MDEKRIEETGLREHLLDRTRVVPDGAREAPTAAPGAKEGDYTRCFRLHSTGSRGLWRCDLPEGHEGLCANYHIAGETALDAGKVAHRGITLDPSFGDPFVWCEGYNHDDALKSDDWILIKAPQLRAALVAGGAGDSPKAPYKSPVLTELPTAVHSTLLEMIGFAAVGKCMACGWPVKASADEGCVQGNCSFRPGEHSSEYLRWWQRTQVLTLARKYLSGELTKEAS